MTMGNVYIVGGGYEDMWIDNGFAIASDLEEADIVQFTGGEDVSPELYGEEKHPTTFSSLERDHYEMNFFEKAKELGIPMVGICRGGQFLNVMCGGKLWQHVDGHATGRNHCVLDTVTLNHYQCSSTHHQMMRPSDVATIIGIADEAVTLATAGEVEPASDWGDVEVVHYEKEGVLCFQPHPEFFHKEHECQVWYYNLISRLLGVEA
jgi:gamma-glutamyl-gamma-aminobutyrate hydrolase PuuD